MTKLNIDFDAHNASPLPVYAKYPGQNKPQPAFIWLDIETGDCGADYSGGFGGCIAEPVWNNRVVFRFAIRANLLAWDLAELLAEIKDDLQTILDGSTIEWDGNKWKGDQDNTKAIIAALQNVEHACESCYSDCLVVDAAYFKEWLADDLYPDDDESVDDFNAAIGNADGCDGYYFDEEMADADKRLAKLEKIWIERLYDGDNLPRAVAQHLLQQGTFDDSAWLDELRVFANANTEELT